MKLPEKCCGKCAFWKHVDAANRKFIGVCNHREHGGEMTDRHEGENCMDFEADEAAPVQKETAPAWAE